MKLKNKIIISVVTVFALIILSFSILMLYFYKKNFTKMRIKTGEAILKSYITDIEYSAMIENKDILKSINSSLKKLDFVDYIVVKKNNKILFSSKNLEKSPIEVSKNITGKVLNKQIHISVTLGLNINDFNSNFKKILFMVIIILGIIISIFGIIISYLISKLLGPLYDMSEKMNSIIKGDYVKIKETSGYKELIPIFNAFNNMIDELTKKEERINQQINEITEKNKILKEKLLEIETLKEAVIMREKLASLGTIVAGVAHEINNPLAAIRGMCELTYYKINDDNFKKLLSKVISYCDRIKSTVETLKVFGKPSYNTKKGYYLISDIIKEAIQMEEHKEKFKDVKIKGNYKKFKKKFLCRKNEMLQLFLNLIDNSVDAMNGNGEIRIDIREKNDFVEIHFKDNGPGIPEVFREKIFDPFFTTKKEDGTGLGLYLCYKIVKENNGEMKLLDSKKGAHFLIKFNLGDFKNEENINS